MRHRYRVSYTHKISGFVTCTRVEVKTNAVVFYDEVEAPGLGGSHRVPVLIENIDRVTSVVRVETVDE